MDTQNQNYNIQDYEEVSPEQPYMVISIGKKHKKRKNYEKAIAKFKLHKELTYFPNTSANLTQFNSLGILAANEMHEVDQIPVIGTQILMQERDIAYQSQFKTLVEINPKVEKEQSTPRFVNIYKLIKKKK